MHHAYLLLGDADSALKLFAEKMRELGVKTQGNPDFFKLEADTLGIDESRLISERAGLKAFGKKKAFLISADIYTLEAQNALLKTLEDPAPNTYFFILARTEGELIPTLLSRVQTLTVRRRAFDSERAEKFLRLSVKNRIALAKEFEGNLGEFLDSLLVIRRDARILRLIRFAGDRGAQPRLLLEHLALVL